MVYSLSTWMGILYQRGVYWVLFHGQRGKEMILFTRTIRLSSKSLAVGTHLAGSKAGSKTSHGSSPMVHFHWLPFPQLPWTRCWGYRDGWVPAHCFSKDSHRFFFQARFYWAPAAAGGDWEEIAGSLACLLPEDGGKACSLYGMRVGVCSRVRLEGWLRWFAHPLAGVLCRGHAQYPAFAPGSSKVAVGFFWSFSMFCPEFTLTVHTHSYFYSHWVSLWA